MSAVVTGLVRRGASLSPAIFRNKSQEVKVGSLDGLGRGFSFLIRDAAFSVGSAASKFG